MPFPVVGAGARPLAPLAWSSRREHPQLDTPSCARNSAPQPGEAPVQGPLERPPPRVRVPPPPSPCSSCASVCTRGS